MGRKGLEIIGVPLNYGASRCGIEYGIENLLEVYPEYRERIHLIDVSLEREDFTNKKLKFLNTISKACNELAQKTEEAVKAGKLPIIMGGDHAIAMGSIAGVSSDRKIGVLWVDAHGDFNTDATTDSGHIHGMPLAASLGYGDKKLTNCHYEGNKVEVEDVVLFGIRSLDKYEEELMNKSGVRCYKYSEIAERGFEVCLAEASEILSKNGHDIHISFDLDSVDPREVTGVSTPVKDGITKDEGIKIFEYMFEKHSISSVDIVEYNPLYEEKKDTADYVNELIGKIEEIGGQ